MMGRSIAGRSTGGTLPPADDLRLPPLRRPASPEHGRQQGRRPSWVRGWRGVALGLSLLLHLAIGWWLMFGFERRAVQEPSAASSMEVVFEGGAEESTPAPPPSGVPAPLEPPEPTEPPQPPEPMPRMAEPPGGGPPGEAPPVAQVPLPVPAPPVAPPVVQAPVPAPPPPAPVAPVPPVARVVPPPVPLPVQPAPSDLSLPPPPPMVEAPSRTEMAAMPLPPPPAPEPAPPEAVTARPVPPTRAPQPRARAAAPGSPFAGALDLSQGPPISLGRPAAPSRPSAAGPRRERDADISTAPAAADAPNAQLRIRGANLGADWRSAFMAWLRQHGYYPRQAAEAGEDGTAIVRFSVDRSGRVSALQLIGRSGSIWLDAGAQALLRGRSVPPFPPGTREDSAEIDLTINYVLRRQ
jgi:protein TonB